MGLHQDNNDIVSTPLQDGQGHCYNLLSPTQVLTGQQLPPQQQQIKKKSRGQRKLQRYRKKFRKQGLDEETIAERIRDISTKSNIPTDEQADDFSVLNEVTMEEIVPLNDQVYFKN
jgi:hypothetical protein